ncbi:MAG: NUDIX hydrolase [Hungatella sp.]|nr:NUDIX hydrolase [Hungatella sp.]
MRNLRQQIEQFTPWNPQEQRDRDVIAACLGTYPDIFFRTNLTMHMTASAWTVNRQRDKVLMVYHNLYDSWSWMGGHADGEEDLLAVALREVKEESGIESLKPVMEEIFSLEVLTVDGHEKRGEYVPSHLHLNVTYLLEADDTEDLRVKPDENSGVAWFGRNEAVAASSEPWFRQRIYGKLNEKLNVADKKR